MSQFESETMNWIQWDWARARCDCDYLGSCFRGAATGYAFFTV